MGRRVGQDPFTVLPVFPVSSDAYRSLANGKSHSGFPDIQSTGIDALRDWIIQGSLPKREDHADAIIHRCQVLFDAIWSWAAGDRHVAAQLPGASRPKVESTLRNFLSELEKVRSTSFPCLLR